MEVNKTFSVPEESGKERGTSESFISPAVDFIRAPDERTGQPIRFERIGFAI
jgi:hypothetical protein